MGCDCLLIPDLYHIPESSGLWTSLADRLKDAVLLCWIHPRPAEWLLQRHRIAGRRLTILNLGSFSDADVRRPRRDGRDSGRARNPRRNPSSEPARWNDSESRPNRVGIRSSTARVASIASTVCNSACSACMSWTPRARSRFAIPTSASRDARRVRESARRVRSCSRCMRRTPP